MAFRRAPLWAFRVLPHQAPLRGHHHAAKTLHQCPLPHAPAAVEDGPETLSARMVCPGCLQAAHVHHGRKHIDVSDELTNIAPAGQFATGPMDEKRHPVTTVKE